MSHNETIIFINHLRILQNILSIFYSKDVRIKYSNAGFENVLYNYV